MSSGGPRRFEGKVIAVTGGGSGLGEAMCLAFSAEGGRVAVLDLRLEAAKKVAGACAGEARPYPCDVADPDSVRETFADLQEDLGPVDVLVNNAGIALHRPDVDDAVLADLRAAMAGGDRVPLRATSTLPDEGWDRVLKVHLYGAFYCSREALKTMEGRRSGVILNMSSAAALRGLLTSPEYTAAKGGVLALTKAMAHEVVGLGIRVNGLAPGYVRTPLTTEEADGRLLPAILAQIPMGRMGEPEEIAALALHLCSGEASYTTGQIVSPNGGLYT